MKKRSEKHQDEKEIRKHGGKKPKTVLIVKKFEGRMCFSRAIC